MGGGHGQGKGLSSSRTGTTSQRTSSDNGRRITSNIGKRISSDEHLELDEEILRQLFLKENPGMDFESLKEEEARLKLEKVNSKSEASVVEKKIPKAKGIVIKERINPEATKAKSQMEIDPRSKGKEKVGELVKVYVPAMDEEIYVEDANLTLISKKISQTNSDMAQVVQSQDIVKDKLKETSDIAHVKSSKLLLPGFTKAKQTQPLKAAASGFKARVVTGTEARDKSGLGSADERRVQNTTNDPTSLSEPGVGATPERLNQLKSVQMVYHTFLKEHILLYFMTDGRVYHIRENAIPLKYFKELEHVLFLLQVKNRLTESAANYLMTQIQRQKKLYSVKSDSTYYPKYRDHKGDIVEMKPNSAKIITTFLGYKVVEFNLKSDKAYLIRLDQDIRKAKINDLRAAIFQIGEDTVELENAKRRMIDELKYVERCLLKNYLRTTPDIKEIIAPKSLPLLHQIESRPSEIHLSLLLDLCIDGSSALIVNESQTSNDEQRSQTPVASTSEQRNNDSQEQVILELEEDEFYTLDELDELDQSMAYLARNFSNIRVKKPRFFKGKGKSFNKDSSWKGKGKYTSDSKNGYKTGSVDRPKQTQEM
ncbi:hypothetical protein AgCh_007681 [Apium graveolens]